MNAEQLGNLELFDKGYITVDYEGYVVKVASPSAYILQKILISPKRSKEKYLKDLESIKLVFEEIKKASHFMNEFIVIISSLGKKRKKIYNSYIKQNNLVFPHINDI